MSIEEIPNTDGKKLNEHKSQRNPKRTNTGDHTKSNYRRWLRRHKIPQEVTFFNQYVHEIQEHPVYKYFLDNFRKFRPQYYELGDSFDLGNA